MDRPCSQCGGKLVGVAFERTVVCSYCQTAQPNLDCLAVGQELICEDEWGRLTLVTVVACRGPDEIDVAGPKTLKLEDVTPVVRPPDSLASGTQVFYRGFVGWERTWTASAAKRGTVKVKNADASFQDDFFNRETSLGSVRIPAKSTDRHHRTAGEALLEAARADPMDFVMSVFHKVVSLGFVLAFALIAAFVIFMFSRG